MPDFGLKAKHLANAKEMLEYCRFIYKIYAQTCEYPMDPFFESHTEGHWIKGGDSARKRLFEKIHKQRNTPEDSTKFDPIGYKLNEIPNPHDPVVYRLDENKKHLLFMPRRIDLSIAKVKGFDLKGQPVGNSLTLNGATTQTRCGYFQGRTGMSKNHKDAGWTSWLGAVLYNPTTRIAVVVFRGSRSGSGERAAIQAQFKSIGNPDWVTDMNHLKGVEVGGTYGPGILAAGFFYCYESAKESIEAAYKWAVGGATPLAVYITGHSLGAAIAQNAYLDFKIGDLSLSLKLRDTEDVTPVYCYSISGPPIIHGRGSHEYFSLRVDASNILHYFCPKDNVHESPLVDPSASKHGLATFMKAFSHPQTDPVHLGSEIALKCTADFPDAHEPVEVWKGMSDGAAPDATFWPTFDIDPSSAEPEVTGLAGGLKASLLLALRPSMDRNLAHVRANLWYSVVKNDSKKEGLQEDVELFRTAMRLIGDLKQVQNQKSTKAQQLRQMLSECRRRLIKQYKNAGGNATGACFFTMLQCLTVEQLILEG